MPMYFRLKGLGCPACARFFPHTVFPAYADKVKGMLSVELNAGQMVEDVRLAVNGKVKVEHFGRLGGIVFTPDEVLNALKEKLF